MPGGPGTSAGPGICGVIWTLASWPGRDGIPGGACWHHLQIIPCWDSVIDFTGISQDWLREAVKVWVAEELPARRGDHATAILQDHVRRAEELSASLRCTATTAAMTRAP